MLALATCHIFTPSIWYGKTWIPGTWLPGWQLAVFQSPRLHECGPADAHGNAQPFCMDKLYFQQKNMPVFQFGRALTQNSWFRPIMSYLWMIGLVMRLFFLWGQPLKIIRKYSVKKGPAPWILFLTPAPWPLEVTFLVGEGEHMCLYPFAMSCKESYPLN